MQRRIYKIKNKQTAEYWTGYGSNFSDKGTEFTSWDAAAYEIRRQLSFKHASIYGWLTDAEIVEFEVVASETGTRNLVEAVQRSVFYDKLSKKYGKNFLRQYHKICDDPKLKGKFRHALKVSQTEFTEFREAMKGLGYSSRHYKKTDEWLWVEDDEVVLRAKLLDYVTMAINLVQEENEFQDQLANSKLG